MIPYSIVLLLSCRLLFIIMAYHFACNYGGHATSTVFSAVSTEVRQSEKRKHWNCIVSVCMLKVLFFWGFFSLPLSVSSLRMYHLHRRDYIPPMRGV